MYSQPATRGTSPAPGPPHTPGQPPHNQAAPPHAQGPPHNQAQPPQQPTYNYAGKLNSKIKL